MLVQKIVALLFACVPATASAQVAAAGYPERPVRIVVSTGVGGAVEAHARIYAARLADSLGKPFIVEVRSGKNHAWSIVTKSAADGHTLLAVAPDFVTAPSLEPELKFDPVRDFAAISPLSQAPYFLAVYPNFAAKSISQLIQIAKAEPGTLNFAGGQPGSGTSLAALLFMSMANIKATYVPYKAATQSLVDLMAGRLHVAVASGNVLPFVQSGKLRVLGTTIARRSTLSPDIPTVAEQGLPGYAVSTFRGLVAPARTPPAVINKLAAEIARIAQLPETVKAITADGSEPITATPQEFRKFIADEVVRWRKVVEANQIKLEK
jgi:tripartite-type tricarboxylate transporter receptor subunit TctC